MTHLQRRAAGPLEGYLILIWVEVCILGSYRLALFNFLFRIAFLKDVHLGHSSVVSLNISSPESSSNWQRISCANLINRRSLPVLLNEKKIDARGISSNRVATVPKLNSLVRAGIY